jgi:hypothetical protein
MLAAALPGFVSSLRGSAGGYPDNPTEIVIRRGVPLR